MTPLLDFFACEEAFYGGYVFFAFCWGYFTNDGCILSVSKNDILCLFSIFLVINLNIMWHPLSYNASRKMTSHDLISRRICIIWADYDKRWVFGVSVWDNLVLLPFESLVLIPDDFHLLLECSVSRVLRDIFYPRSAATLHQVV